MQKLCKTGLLAGVVLVVAGSCGRAVDQDEVKQAIDKGVAALRKMQGADGTWPYPDIGATSLAGLTLLECGVSVDDKAVQRAADAVRRASINLTHTYSIALSILFFNRLGDPGDVPLIESLTVRLLAGQTVSGGWDYDCPSIVEGEMRRLKAKVDQRKELAGRREPPKPDAAKRTAKDLPKEIQHQLAMLERAGGLPRGSDNSNTQFATLALWVGRRYGLPVEKALKRVETRFRTSQNTDGGWGYFDRDAVRGPLAGSTASMTCAGLLGLAVADGTVLEKTKDNKPGDKPKADLSKDTHLSRGLLALGTVIGNPIETTKGKSRGRGERVRAGPVGGRTYYFLWSLERVAVALDLKTIGKKDWYGWGAEILLANQQADGSWMGNYALCGADTCFALLFLKRANVAPDLTMQLAGQVQDLEKVLRAGGVGGGTLVGSVSDLKSGIESKEAKPMDKPIDKPAAKPPQEVPPKAKLPQDVSANAKPPQDGPAKDKPRASASARLAADLVKSSGSRFTQLLDQLRMGKGPLFTEALALAIPQLKGEKQSKVRAALVERLTRMNVKTLTNYLEDEDIEIRRAAALACATKKDKALVPGLIALLRDAEEGVARSAHAALKDLTGKDFGPAANASREERDQAVRQWLDWWNKQERK